ncbi:MAG: hypothetical protein J2P45_05875 [Candidatus Dormibacteraeota bacterium]|nr:hypothetical protein [Candidatus Dormibacteraeota bacterium]
MSYQPPNPTPVPQWSPPPQWQQPPQTYPVQAPLVVPAVIEPKDKTTSVLLAVFLGAWTWVYTYKTDAAFFWINLVLSILTGGFWVIVAWPWAIICAATRPQAWYANFPYGNAYRMVPLQQYQPPELPEVR